ncbi:putative CLAVATA3/ESR (CLE)-related protein 27 [Cocos nucifera]|uniref:Putative CLAVATA3/ESR (CLE)-related protein 27 n=1 Tax=Cocos nucifera TaxID=13894 RepID=A0A8K0IB42_COCNU|nr:putative CLAVATA3/ESR (CLE)-related protein 27 [Cocos nucifera]
MSTAGRSRRTVACFAVVLLSVWLLHGFVCFNCRAMALRIFPVNSGGKSRGAPLIGRRPIPLRPSTAAVGGMHDSKRVVPSCPDPLHNR